MTASLQRILLISIFATMSIFIARAQSPKQEVVVQAASPAIAAAAAPTVSAQSDSSAIMAAIKALEQLKAKNDEILSKQEATLQRLDELQQATEQMRVFSKRG